MSTTQNMQFDEIKKTLDPSKPESSWAHAFFTELQQILTQKVALQDTHNSRTLSTYSCDCFVFPRTHHMSQDVSHNPFKDVNDQFLLKISAALMSPGSLKAFKKEKGNSSDIEFSSYRS